MLEMRHLAPVMVLTIAASGCATAPHNTPGAGSGSTYTPVVDMQGVDPARYSRDLGECRTYAHSVDNQAAAMQGAIGGAILMGVLSAALGGNSQMNTQAASAGGFAGLVGNEGRALGKQERIIVNCMSGRGYRTLDAAMVFPAMPPAPAPTAAPLTTAPSIPAVAGSSPYYTPQEQPSRAEPVRTGQDGFAAEALARDQLCAATPRAVLVGKGPGFETYSVLCSNADVLMLRCEFGNCRALR